MLRRILVSFLVTSLLCVSARPNPLFRPKPTLLDSFSITVPGRRPQNRLALSQPLVVRWRYESNTSLNLTPAAHEEQIYVPQTGGTIVSLRVRDAQLNWRSEVGGEISASPVADDRGVYVASEILGTETAATQSPDTNRPSGTLRALSKDGGLTRWVRTLIKPLQGALAIEGDVLFAGGSDGRFYAFDKETGSLLWSIHYGPGFRCQPVGTKGRVYAGSEDGTLLVLEAQSGKLAWLYKTKGPIRGPVATNGQTIFFGSQDGYVYAVTAERGKLLWRKRTGAGVEAVVQVADSVLVASLDNFVYSFSSDGTRVWKKQLPGRISSQPLTAEDGALFTPLSSVAAVVLGLRDGRQINSLPTGEEISTTASPIAVGDTVLLTTEHGVLAFANAS